MSGGSMNYLYSRLEMDATFEQNTPERIAFAKHLELVAKALHDIEWVDSCDYGLGADAEAIRACLGGSARDEALMREALAMLTVSAERLWDAGWQRTSNDARVTAAKLRERLP